MWCQGKLTSLSDSLTATHKWACAINAPDDTLLWEECSMTHCCGNTAPQPPRKVCVSRKLCHCQYVLREKSRDVETPELSITCSQGPKPLAASTRAWLSRGLPCPFVYCCVSGDWTLRSLSSANTCDDQANLIQSY